ncbi:MAG: hypothetical protein CMP10_20290 [Zetaproteobacteria bacterium]|nr:hypothetical protein [Pseudobdellovibrionaceae bacterium]
MMNSDHIKRLPLVISGLLIALSTFLGACTENKDADLHENGHTEQDNKSPIIEAKVNSSATTPTWRWSIDSKSQTRLYLRPEARETPRIEINTKSIPPQKKVTTEIAMTIGQKVLFDKVKDGLKLDPKLKTVTDNDFIYISGEYRYNFLKEISLTMSLNLPDNKDKIAIERILILYQTYDEENNRTITGVISAIDKKVKVNFHNNEISLQTNRFGLYQPLVMNDSWLSPKAVNDIPPLLHESNFQKNKGLQVKTHKKENSLNANENITTKDLVIDNKNNEFLTAKGSWKESSNLPGAWDGTYLIDQNFNKGQSQIIISPPITNKQYYEILVTWTPGKDRATHVPVYIERVNQKARYIINQTNSPGKPDNPWYSLGYHLLAPKKSRFIIENGLTNGQVVFDAVKFSPKPKYKKRESASKGKMLINTFIMDSNDLENVEINGEWYEENLPKGFNGTGYHHDAGINKGKASIQFHPTITKPGYYKVYLHWVLHPKGSNKVPVKVVTSKGPKVRYINQTSHGSSWRGIGYYHLSPKSARISINNNLTTGSIVVDAIKLIRIPPQKIRSSFVDCNSYLPKHRCIVDGIILHAELYVNQNRVRNCEYVNNLPKGGPSYEKAVFSWSGRHLMLQGSCKGRFHVIHIGSNFVRKSH